MQWPSTSKAHRSGLQTLLKTWPKKCAAPIPSLPCRYWQGKAEQLIALVKAKTYQQAAVYLRRMRKLYEQRKRLDELEKDRKLIR